MGLNLWRIQSPIEENQGLTNQDGEEMTDMAVGGDEAIRAEEVES